MWQRRALWLLPIALGTAVYVVLELIAQALTPAGSAWSKVGEVVAVCVALLVALLVMLRRPGRP